MTKSVTISAKVTQDQKADLERKASASNMKLNEYIKTRLFYDEDTSQSSKLVPDIDRRNYLMACKTYALTEKLFLNTFKDPQLIKEIENFAIENVKERGLLPNKHISTKE